LSELSGNFNEYQMFLFNTSVGNYYAFMFDYNSALQSYEKAILYSSKINIAKWEEADFNYVLGQCYLTQQRWLIAVEYTQKALEYFKSGFYNTRVIECYLILSIAQESSYQMDEAFENLLLAQKIATQLNLSEHFPIIKQNLGSCASSRGNSFEAIQYYMESLESREDDAEKLLPIYSLVKEYSKIKDSEQVSEWASLGLSLIHKNHNPTLQSFTHHLNVYLAREDNIGLFEKVTIDAINYFKEIRDYRHTEKYSLLLGHYYYENNKYKNAAKYFALSNENMYKKHKISYWEDL